MSNESIRPRSPRLPTATVSSGVRKPYRRRLSNYLLNKSLQLRYVGFVTVLSAVITSSLGYLIWKQEAMASDEILASVADLCAGEDAGDCELQEVLGAELHRRDNNLVLQMVGVGIGLVVILGLYLVVMTHKVAGPLYKISTYFDHMAEGRMGEIYPLRKGDLLQDFYSKFKEMHDDVRDRYQRDNELVGRFLQACEDAGVSRSGELGARIDELEAHYKDRARALA